LADLDHAFADVILHEDQFPPSAPDMKILYTNYYDGMMDLTNNFVCSSCGCIGHNRSDFVSISVDDVSLRHLQVDPSLVPYDFASGVPTLDERHIMIDTLGIVNNSLNELPSLLICHTCQRNLKSDTRPRESLANYRWIGAVPHQLQDLTWIEELLIARAHLTGHIVRLQNRNTTSFFGLKGHVILLPQDTTELLDILPLPPSSLPDIVRVVWVGRPVRNIDVLRDHFSVRTNKIYDALLWLVENNEDYKDVTIDHSQFERWPPIWVAEDLLAAVGGLEDGSDEDNARTGVASEDIDNPEMDGDLPLTTSGIVDIDSVSQPSQLKTLQHISLCKDEKTINVLTSNNILSEQTHRSYFTSAFPTIFPWGTGKHLDDRRSEDLNLDLKKWVQLLLRNSSRYTLLILNLISNFRRFQRHRGFVILCYDVLRRRHSLSKSNLITSRDAWKTTGPLLESLTDERLKMAATQAAKHKPITDTAVKKLLAMVGTIGSTSPGSEERKSYDLARMKSATVHFGLPQIFITLNPADTSSPVSLFYAGEKIDVKSFHPRLYSAADRLKTMLDNPLAVVEYFHNTINTIVETLLKGGMFGELQHYQGSIEYQGRGTPHVHLLVPNLNELANFQLWIKGGGSPRLVRNKAKNDLAYRQRLLEYIETVCSQCMPEQAVDDANPEAGIQTFQPMTPPNHPAFEDAVKMVVFDVVRSRQMHNEKHTPTCFKYRSKRKCRFRFARKLIPHTAFDETTGVIVQKRDHEWLNNYNLWFSLVMRTNHDSQYLFNQEDALARIYYVMKYVSKTEETTYSKLTIAAAVAKELSKSRTAVCSKGKSMLIRTYNKISSHREVGVPEAISHLLDFPDTITGAIFENIHTTHLLDYLKAPSGDRDEPSLRDSGDSSIVRVRDRTTIVSAFDDYAHRGPELENMCLYDYCSLVYKSRDAGGLQFDTCHPQHTTHRQFVRKTRAAIPTLLGRLLFLRPDSDDEAVKEDHFCILSGLFVPWNNERPPQKSSAASWEQLFSMKKPDLSRRILRYIDNLTLLHKSKEEARIDQMRQQAQYGHTEDNADDDENSDPLCPYFHDDDDEARDHEWFFDSNNTTWALAAAQSALEGSSDSVDEYVQEAMSANFANGYFNTTPESPSAFPAQPAFRISDEQNDPIFTPGDINALRKLLKKAEMQQQGLIVHNQLNEEITPGVFISGSDTDSLIRDFSLNSNQSRAFRIICNHALGHHLPSESQLLMGVFGEGGTGKSRLIDAIRVWFSRNHRGKELIVAATTGTAAIKIKGSTVHSAVSIPIETTDGKRLGKLSPTQIEAWGDRQYMVIDEISMLDCKVMEHLHMQLSIVKANPETSFGGVNIIFFGDFLQLPAVRNPDLYVDNPNWGLGHRLWRSLNAVVILKEQMRQAGDPIYAAILSRIRLRVPTDEDIEILRRRIGARLPNIQSVPAVVRRHTLRQAMNNRRLQEAELTSDTEIMYCVADVTEVKKMSIHQAYQVQFGDRGSKVDAIIPLVRGVPLLVTHNANKPLGTNPLSYRSIN
jgi:hypothetical protein